MWLFFYDCHSVNYILKRLLVIFRQIWRRTSMKFVPRYGFFVLALCCLQKSVSRRQIPIWYVGWKNFGISGRFSLTCRAPPHSIKWYPREKRHRDIRLLVVKKISPDWMSGLIGNFSYGAGLMLFSWMGVFRRGVATGVISTVAVVNVVWTCRLS